MSRDHIRVDVIISYGSTMIAERVKFHSTEDRGYTEAEVPNAVQDGFASLGEQLANMFVARFSPATTKPE